MSDQRTRQELLLANVDRGQCPYCEGALGDPGTNDYRPCLGCQRQWKIDIVHGRPYAVSISPPGMLREFHKGRLPSPFCHEPTKCMGLGSCPRKPACNDRV
jgi:hypothetical protein